jgi:hypothetical protein
VKVFKTVFLVDSVRAAADNPAGASAHHAAPATTTATVLGEHDAGGGEKNDSDNCYRNYYRETWDAECRHPTCGSVANKAALPLSFWVGHKTRVSKDILRLE